MPKIKSVLKAKVFHVKMKDDDDFKYIRFSSEFWMIQKGDSYHSVFHCEELEHEFQKYKKKLKNHD